MPVITNSFIYQVLQDLYDDFSLDSNSNYFIGIGRSEEWDSDTNPDVPRTNERDAREARLSLQSVKIATDASFVVQRRQWASGLVYYQYDDDDVGYNPDQPFYVINSNQEVYICTRQAKSATTGLPLASTIQPSGNTTGTPFLTADGYQWKFLYSIGALRASKFLSSSYMPVTRILSTDSDSPAEDLQQETVQGNAVRGQIINYVVTNGGSGYNTATDPTVTITGNGSGAVAYARVVGDQVTEILVKEDSSGNAGSSYFGSGYEYADVEITGGGGEGATARAVIAPENGLGYDARKDLRSYGIMFNAKIDGDEGGDFVIGTDVYRQITLLKNVRVSPDSDGGQAAILADQTGIGLRKITHGNTDWTSAAVLKAVVNGPDGAQAYIDKVNSTSTAFWYHQTEETGFKDFQPGDTITIADTDLTATIDSDSDADFDVMSGELLYIDNRSPVNRLTDQEDDLKVVITV